MFDIGTSLLIALAFAFPTAGIVGNYAKSLWTCLIWGVATFALVTAELLLNLETLFIITVIVFALAAIFTLIKLKLHH